MKPFKWWEKILTVLLTLLFIPSFFFSTVFALKKPEEDPRFIIVGIIIFIINISIFYGLYKIISKYYDYRNRKGVKRFFYVIIIIPIPLTLSFLAFYNLWAYMLVYPIIVYMYWRIIEKRYGRFSVKIDKLYDGLLVGDISSFNTDVKVISKNKKIKSSGEEIKTGDIIRIEKDGEAILTLDVIKNEKKK